MNADDGTDMLNADGLLLGQFLPVSCDGNGKKALQSPSQGTIDDMANAPVSQASTPSLATHLAAQSFPAPDSVELSQATHAAHWQHEEHQGEPKHNAQDQVQLVLDKPARKATMDLHESAVPLRIVESDEAEKREKQEKEKGERKEKKKQEDRQKEMRETERTRK